MLIVIALLDHLMNKEDKPGYHQTRQAADQYRKNDPFEDTKQQNQFFMDAHTYLTHWRLIC